MLTPLKTDPAKPSAAEEALASYKKLPDTKGLSLFCPFPLIPFLGFI
jgi:hypothetical protein